MGYSRAGFDEIVGIDIVNQPNYPFHFIKADALRPPVRLEDFDLIHASPPCQAHSAGKNMWKGRLEDDRHPDLVGPTRVMLQASGVPFVIENVEGAPLTDYITLCGDSFGLGVKRHRLFETSWFIWNPPACRPDHPDFVVSVFGGGALSRTPRGGWTQGTGNFMQRRVHVAHEQAKIAMGIDWMTRDELSQAIPPAFCQFIGEQFLHQLATT